MSEKINSHYDIKEYAEGVEDGKNFEWRKTHDSVIGAPCSPMSPINIEVLTERIFSETTKRSVSYQAGFKAGQEEYKNLSPFDQIQFGSRRPR